MRNFTRFSPVRPTSGRIHAIEGGNKLAIDRYKRGQAAKKLAKFPRRPQTDVLSNSITLFFIARNRLGLWIAREAAGRTGGVFLFRRSALRFAEQNSGGKGCATMVLAEQLELDVANQGNQFIGWIGRLLGLVAQYVRKYPPPLPMLEKRKTEWP